MKKLSKLISITLIICFSLCFTSTAWCGNHEENLANAKEFFRKLDDYFRNTDPKAKGEQLNTDICQLNLILNSIDTDNEDYNILQKDIEKVGIDGLIAHSEAYKKLGMCAPHVINSYLMNVLRFLGLIGSNKPSIIYKNHNNFCLALEFLKTLLNDAVNTEILTAEIMNYYIDLFNYFYDFRNETTGTEALMYATPPEEQPAFIPFPIVDVDITPSPNIHPSNLNTIQTVVNPTYL